MNNEFRSEDRNLVKINKMGTNEDLGDEFELGQNKIDLFTNLKEHEGDSSNKSDKILKQLRFEEIYDTYQYINHNYLLLLFTALHIHFGSFAWIYLDNQGNDIWLKLYRGYYSIGLFLSVIYSVFNLVFLILSEVQKTWLISFLFSLVVFFFCLAEKIIRYSILICMILIALSVLICLCIVIICIRSRNKLTRDQIVINLVAVTLFISLVAFFFRFNLSIYLNTYHQIYFNGWYSVALFLMLYTTFYNLFIGLKHYQTINRLNRNLSVELKTKVEICFIFTLILTLINIVLYFMVNNLGKRIPSLVVQFLIFFVYIILRIIRDLIVKQTYGGLIYKKNRLSIKRFNENKVFAGYVQERATLVERKDADKLFSEQKCLGCFQKRTALYFSCGHNINCESCGIRQLKHSGDCEICGEDIQYVAVLIEDKNSSQLATKMIIVKEDK